MQSAIVCYDRNDRGYLVVASFGLVGTFPTRAQADRCAREIEMSEETVDAVQQPGADSAWNCFQVWLSTERWDWWDRICREEIRTLTETAFRQGFAAGCDDQSRRGVLGDFSSEAVAEQLQAARALLAEFLSIYGNVEGTSGGQAELHIGLFRIWLKANTLLRDGG